jgi:hypothetical protein
MSHTDQAPQDMGRKGRLFGMPKSTGSNAEASLLDMMSRVNVSFVLRGTLFRMAFPIRSGLRNKCHGGSLAYPRV